MCGGPRTESIEDVKLQDDLVEGEIDRSIQTSTNDAINLFILSDDVFVSRFLRYAIKLHPCSVIFNHLPAQKENFDVFANNGLAFVETVNVLSSTKTKDVDNLRTFRSTNATLWLLAEVDSTLKRNLIVPSKLTAGFEFSSVITSFPNAERDEIICDFVLNPITSDAVKLDVLEPITPSSHINPELKAAQNEQHMSQHQESFIKQEGKDVNSLDEADLTDSYQNQYPYTYKEPIAPSTSASKQGQVKDMFGSHAQLFEVKSNSYTP